ncbi:RNA polymerase subunit sigma-70 [Saccharothrix sp. HUAS TT1]|uniref:RNA polymerase subunit sigma-70 n=1 Tax=unclassified Saccharothrix TaxID=2593673 RepID=UPI00345BF3A6
MTSTELSAHPGAGGRPGGEDFARLTDPYRHELLAHCHRMLGSVHDAEDQVQETMLRAWRSYQDFEGRSSLRSWLYRIATNVCLTALESRSRNPLPSGLPADDRHDADGTPAVEPDADPAAIVSSRENMRLALAVAWQHLAPQQRAVLILRDVLGWRANEVAAVLGTSGAAVHSMLRRARAQLAQAAPTAATVEPERRHLLDRYAAAFEDGDITALVNLLTSDVVCSVSTAAEPLTGREAIGRYLAHCPALGDCRMIPITVHERHGFAVYRPGPDGVHRAYSIEVLTETASGIERIDVVEDPALFTTFGLPKTHPGAEAAVR